jgi:hypothetical protein
MGLDINVHDQWAVESPGPIFDRTREHLATSDKAIIAYRRMLRKAIEAAGEGGHLPGIPNGSPLDTTRDRLPWTPLPRMPAGKGSGASVTRSAGPIAPGQGADPFMSDVGREGLAARAGVDTKDRRAACAQVLEQIEQHGIETVRLSFADQHGILRGKTLMAAQAQLVPGQWLRHDLDTAGQGHLAPHRVSGVVRRRRSGLPQMEGAGDFMMLPDPATFRVLPWVEFVRLAVV